jgi:2,3-diaminopropionate biosynthesis protein SbnA
MSPSPGASREVPSVELDAAAEERLASLRRLLERAGVPYHILAHETTVISAQMGVEKGVGSLDEMAPTLILKSEKGLLAAIVSGRSRLSYRKIKKELGLKDVSFASSESVRLATGAEVGTVSLINEGLPTIVDSRLAGIDAVYGGCGAPRHTLHIRTQDLIAVTSARVFDFTELRREPPGSPALRADGSTAAPAASATPPPARSGLRSESEPLADQARRVCDGILDAVGDTPLVRLRRYLPAARFELFAKLEALNPAGSSKDRPAVRILEHALRSGALQPGAVVIESSSGNMGIGLAQACRYYGLRFICVVDPKTTASNLGILRVYGAEIDCVNEPDPDSGEFLQARLKRVQELLARIAGSFWPNQYANTRNSEAHFRSTMHEVATALNGKVDFLFVPTSTCGTLRGCSEYVRHHALGTRVIAVDAFGSMIFSDVRAKRVIPGLGAGLRPPLYDDSLIDDYVQVSDLDCVVGCRRLMEREAILAGGSSGGVLRAVEAYAGSIPSAAVVVAILPDRGERYLESLFSDDWVREQLGDIQSLWRGSGESS